MNWINEKGCKIPSKNLSLQTLREAERYLPPALLIESPIMQQQLEMTVSPGHSRKVPCMRLRILSVPDDASRLEAVNYLCSFFLGKEIDI
jgi:hypothetical protein